MKRVSVLAVFACSIVPAFAGEFPSDLPKVPDPTYCTNRGDRAVLGYYGEKQKKLFKATVAKYSHVYKEYWEALEINDDNGMNELREKNVLVNVELGTPVLVLEIEVFESKDPRADCAVVRILDGPLQGTKVWVSRFSVSRMIDNPDYKPPAKALEKKSDPGADDKKAENPAPEAPDPAKDASKKAAGLMTIAADLEKIENVKAALEYYRQVVRDFPKTPEAKKAAARIKALDGKP